MKHKVEILERYNGSSESLIEDLEAHNLTQQAKGLHDLVNDYFGDCRSYTFTEINDAADIRYHQLLKQAKEINNG